MRSGRLVSRVSAARVMKISVANVASTDHDTPLLAVGVFEGEEVLAGPVQELDERMNGAISEVIRRGDFRGKDGQTLLLYPRGAVPAERVLLVGLGKRPTVDTGRIRNGAATATRTERADLRRNTRDTLV